MSVTMQRRTLSLAEFCDEYGLGRSIVREMIDSGEIPSFKVGRRRLIAVDQAEAWLSNKVSASTTVGV